MQQPRQTQTKLAPTAPASPLRAGAGDGDLEQIVRDAVCRKELKHRIGDAGFIQPGRTMSAIGD